MRAVIQRVSRASVTVEGAVTGEIGLGLLVLVGIATDDTPDDIAWLAGKIAQQKLFFLLPQHSTIDPQLPF